MTCLYCQIEDTGEIPGPGADVEVCYAHETEPTRPDHFERWGFEAGGNEQCSD